MLKNLFIFMQIALAAVSLSAQSMLIEGESFQFLGDWATEKMPHSRVKNIGANTSKFSPLTVVDIKDSAEYDIWASSYDFAKNAPRSRFYNVEIDGKPLPERAGVHGRDGFYWEKIGRIALAKGEHTIQLRVGGGFSRCDAILLTADAGLNPNSAGFASLRKKITVSPKTIKFGFRNYFINAPKLSQKSGAEIVEIANRSYKLKYIPAADASGKTFYVRGAEVLKDGKWFSLEPFVDESFFTLYSRDISYRDTSYFSMWSNARGKAVAKINGVETVLDLSPSNPYAVGHAALMRPVSAKKISERCVVLKFENGATGIVELPETGQIAKFKISYTAPKDGFYSLGLRSFNEVKKEDVVAAFMPTPYQGKRLMREPKMMTTTLLSQPVSIIQTNTGKLDITSGVVGDPDCLPFEWSKAGRAVYGFSLSAPDYLPQAAIFRPILGGRDSYKKAGENIESSFYAINIAGDWRDAFEYFNSNIFASKNIRESFKTSFSDALSNIAKYLKDGVHSGWSAKHKARWNIEGEDLSTHSSPMAEIEVALLTDDEPYYRDIALPTLEYTLTRKGAHFRTFRTDNADYGVKLHELKVAGDFWKADYFVSANKLLGSKNAWLDDFAKTASGKLRFADGNTPAWTQKLGYYLAKPSPELLAEIRADCDVWIEKNFSQKYSYEPNFVSFINYGLYPYWWYLPELYNITGDKKYLDYAERGAFFTLTSLWNFPTPPDGDVVINKGNFSDGISALWWRGRERHRVGADISMAAAKMLRAEKTASASAPYVIPEKTVSAESVSRIGVGIEQHSTYIGRCSNILMPSWANEMLKVYQYDGRDILMKFSRHSIIGRYANFAGYYLCGFSDIMQDADYPYRGPDITSFYYHHAPCHFAQTADYLFTQIEIASKGAVRFPYVRQQGYVWFTDRIFGEGGGTVFDDADSRPLIAKDAVSVDSPKVSVMLARSKNSIWAIIYNDSASARTVTLEFNPTARLMEGALTDAPVALYRAESGRVDAKYSFFGNKKIEMSAMGLAAFKIPAREYVRASGMLAPLGSDSHIKIARTADNWGEFHAFRIRGPFGKDSIYAMFTDGFERPNAKIALKIKSAGRETEITRGYFPFEISVYPLSPSEDIEFSVSAYENGAEIFNTGRLVLKK